MRKRRFVQVDVFSPKRVQGNGLAVVVDSEKLTDDDLKRFAAWTISPKPPFFTRRRIQPLTTKSGS